MKRFAGVMLLSALALPAHAFWGMGDVTYDPTAVAEITKNLEEMKKIYQAARDQIDGLSKIERTIKDAQQAYETLSSGDLQSVVSGMQMDTGNVKSAADLRARFADMESKGGRAVNYMEYQLSLIDRLGDLGKLQKASASNLGQATNKSTVGTNSAITAQSTAALAALAAAEEQRNVEDELQRQKAEKNMQDDLAKSGKLYEALSK